MRRLILLGICGMGIGILNAAEEMPLFDGASLKGWEGHTRWWRVSDGALEGGSSVDRVPHNFFLATEATFHNFELRLKIKLSGPPETGLINSGIQIRSQRVPGSTEMSGYQLDYGAGWYGKLYDESRRNRVIDEPANLDAVNAAVREGDWNNYRIRAVGPRIQSWINDVPAIDFVETEPNIPQNGRIGIQIHAGGQATVRVKDVFLRRLPDTPGAPTWQSAKRPSNQNSESDLPPFSPERERQTFTVPSAFEVELVAAESEGIGKFITVAFDAQGRMWTMTALEYPLDANESKGAAEALFAKGGQDKVLVFDNVYESRSVAARQPRIFAEGLAMPLGLLPYHDGAIVQYGHEIRYYRDTNADGVADGHKVILTGFGIQDSHLFPHQFTRVPGGYFYLAQGLFNSSNVRRPGGLLFNNGQDQISFNHCKLGRFKPDGSEFEALTAGPNNIWGLTISREGETWIQEANDLGYPVMPFEPGAHYATGSRDRLKPYQPLMPPTLHPPQMGGTGLSGLALADDDESPFADPSLVLPEGKSVTPGTCFFYLANPIIGRVQLVTGTPKNGRLHYEKQDDFLVSEDPWFRPIAITFGPDGCLYVVDWYNKIISHNEVSRYHPDRDKSRGRIWRICHRDQSRKPPVNLGKLEPRQLLAHLGSPNARIADLAWQELVDRNDLSVREELLEIATTPSHRADRRLGALWVLEGTGKVPFALLKILSTDANANVRREAVRIAGSQDLTPAEFIALVSPLLNDPSSRVRAALGDAFRRIPNPTLEISLLMAQLGNPLAPPANAWDRYDRAFERFLARWAMEQHPQTVAAMLESPPGKSLPVECRVWATLALGGRDASIGLSRLLPELRRPLQEEEVRMLASHFYESEVANTLRAALASAETRLPTLRSLLAIRTSVELAPLQDSISQATQELLSSSDPEVRAIGIEAAAAFRVESLEDALAVLLNRERQDGSSARPLESEPLAALRALTALRSERIDLFLPLLSSSDFRTRDAAAAALIASRSPQAGGVLLQHWSKLNGSQRSATAERLASTRQGASDLVEAMRSGNIRQEELSLETLEKMHVVLQGNPEMESLWQDITARLRYALHLQGGNDDAASRSIDLEGPFTVEAWVNLDPGIDNRDGILGQANQLDMNFYASQFRVWVQEGRHDIVVAQTKTTPNTWTHYAVTRDRDGVFRIYVNGELDATSTGSSRMAFKNLHVGRTTAQSGGTKGRIMELRIWNIAKSAEEIRHHFDRVFQENDKPTGLVHLFTGSAWGGLSGNASVKPIREGPTLLTAAEAALQDQKFARYRHWAAQQGDVNAGRELFTALCLTCHQLQGQGGKIAPPLDGVGNTGVDAILRNLVTPNAAVEGGYRAYRITTREDEVLEGLLVEESEEAMVIRQANLPDQRVPREEVQSAGYLNRSIMPEGMLDSLPEASARDLLSFLQSLK